jgi:phospholysine phosphohistidine inorganic pyrophosphate phosphatase
MSDEVGSGAGRPPFAGVIFDIDGVLEFRGAVFPRAVETVVALREAGLAVRFLTNSTLKSRASCAEKLRRRGFEAYEAEVVTASYATATYLREQGARSCWVLLDGDGRREFDGLAHDDEAPEYVVVGDYREGLNWSNMNRALRLVLRGARLVGMQSELLDRSAAEDEQLNVGAWARMLEQAAGVKATYIGKPEAYVFALVLRTMDLDRSQVLMVGDKVSTDIRGANDFGLPSALLRTGEFDEAELDGSVRPDFILECIGDLPALLGLGEGRPAGRFPDEEGR